MKGRTQRIGRYLQSMFPPALTLPAAALSFLAGDAALQALGSVGGAPRPLRAGAAELLGALVVWGLQLLLRVYDELKDAETDLRLGAAGDPHYRDRPLVTGEVTVEDIAALRTWTTTALLALQVPIGWLYGAVPVLAFVGVFALCWLSSRWFFWPAMRDHLLVAFATHNPIGLFVGGYVLALVHAAHAGLAFAPAPVLALLCGLWLPVAAWELGRKVRLPAEETDYQTYSKLLGWRLAGTLPALCVLGAALCLGLALRPARPGAWLWACLGIAALVPLGATLRLHLVPSPRATALRPFVEAAGAVLHVGLAVGLAWERGIVLGS
ncbi:MAG: hypothetical protein D6731_07955 [Planctomycetota bacterium]|nr:MAG: hypothetical protein D6731_07955 [Planctomycetota bacterium]